MKGVQQSPGQPLPGEPLQKGHLAQETEKTSPAEENQERLACRVWRGIDERKKKKGGRKEITTEAKSWRSWRRDQHTRGVWAFLRNRETAFVTDGIGDRLRAQRQQLVGLPWEDERVQLESLALNPLVYLLDNPYGKPVYKSQQVFGEDQKFSLALPEGVCIAELISEPRLTLGKIDPLLEVKNALSLEILHLPHPSPFLPPPPF